MKKSYLNIYTFGLLLLSLLGGASCNLASGKVEETSANGNTARIESSNSAETPKRKSVSNINSQITSATVAGAYKYYTVRDGEGYDNSLDIEDKGNGKLGVSLAGSYVYTVDGSESMHEAEGAGDAMLQGNTAVANLKDEDDKNCRVTITFSSNGAKVAIPDVCHFNIALDGVYKKETTKSIEKSDAKPVEKPAKDSPKAREVSYDKLEDFVNDFGSHKVGERFVIINVPAGKIAKNSRADEFGNSSYKGLFYLESDDDEGNTSNGFFTSPAMVKSLASSGEYEPTKLRITAVLIESTGKFDVYRISFATVIEGLADDGSVMWTATGAEPARTKLVH